MRGGPIGPAKGSTVSGMLYSTKNSFGKPILMLLAGSFATPSLAAACSSRLPVTAASSGGSGPLLGNDAKAVNRKGRQYM